MGGNHHGLALLVTLAAYCAECSNAAERCVGVAVTEVRSLASLPADIRKHFPANSSGLEGIADRGGSFNVTDDGIDHDLPMTRFTLAAVGATCAVIAVEHGGYAHSFELTEFRLSAGVWGIAGSRSVFAEPKAVHDLLVDRE
jgi:hypothetical protein